ncbi:MAG: hypothetical protein Q9173_001273 [Seirophora scorigena]
MTKIVKFAYITKSTRLRPTILRTLETAVTHQAVKAQRVDPKGEEDLEHPFDQSYESDAQLVSLPPLGAHATSKHPIFLIDPSRQRPSAPDCIFLANHMIPNSDDPEVWVLYTPPKENIRLPLVYYFHTNDQRRKLMLCQSPLGLWLDNRNVDNVLLSVTALPMALIDALQVSRHLQTADSEKAVVSLTPGRALKSYHHELAHVVKSQIMSKKRKAPPRAAKKDPWSIDELLTSSKSRLIDIDLHGSLAEFFSDESNWAQIPDSEKDFIRDLLPSHLELNEDGSIPSSFWKHSSEFRLDCRNLQEDLRSGRMDPEWQRQAAQAMEERAAGKFDDFKEKEFEEFWGQKQKVDSAVLAGNASRVKLDELLREGLFKVGDMWCFDYTWGRGADAIRVEKECKIVKIDGKSITLAIPSGQLKFARRLDQTSSPEKDETIASHVSTVTPKIQTMDGNDTSMQEVVMIDGDAEVKEPSTFIPQTGSANEVGEDARGATEIHKAVHPADQEAAAGNRVVSADVTDIVRTEPLASTEVSAPPLLRESSTVSSELSDPPPSPEEAVSSIQPTVDGDPDPFPASTEHISPFNDHTDPLSATAEHRPTITVDPDSLPAATHYNPTVNDHPDPLSAATEYDVVLYTTTGMWELEKQIVQIDGRAKPGSRTASTWRAIRCRRNEQDMGSLFEIRDEYYAYKINKGDYRCERRS